MESYFPSKGGMPEVVKQLSERMAAAGNDVIVFTSFNAGRKPGAINGVKIMPFSISGNKTEGIKGNTEEYFLALKNGNFDVIVFFAAQQWATDSVIDRLAEIPGKKVFVPTGFSHFYNPAYGEYYENMKTWMKAFDKNVFLSDNYQDINFARENGITKNILIPNGAASDEFEGITGNDFREKLDIGKEELMILHVGTYTGVKGHREALHIFIRSAVKNATLVLIGDKIKYLEKAFQTHYSYFGLRLQNLFKRKRIIFLETDRRRTVEAFKSADLFLFPSNVECSPVVLFESMAAGVPFLASPAGNTEEIIQWTEAGWLMPGDKEKNGWVKINIPQAIKEFEKACASREKLKEAGRRGHEIWKKKFTWEKITDQYLELYHQLTGN